MNQNEDFKTFEEVEAYVDQLNATLSKSKAFDEALGVEQVCKYYKIIRPILKAVLLLPLIPEKIKVPIRLFMDLMDKLCPTV
jgi:hypothetical protein